MKLAIRLEAAFGAAFRHLVFSVLLAGVVAALVFGIWYPSPYSELAGGQELFWLIVGVDVVCGPLLTLIIYDPKKPRAELVRDIGLVVLIQLAALAYGLNSLAQARPVWLAFEKDLFRVVRVPDITPGTIKDAPETLRSFSLTGPKPVGVRLAKGTDPDFLENVQQSMAGNHAAFRPGRWISYSEQATEVARVAKPIGVLQSRYVNQSALISRAVKRSGRKPDTLGYLPLMSENRSDWVVLVDRATGEPVGYVPLDGWDN